MSLEALSSRKEMKSICGHASRLGHITSYTPIQSFFFSLHYMYQYFPFFLNQILKFKPFYLCQYGLIQHICPLQIYSIPAGRNVQIYSNSMQQFLLEVLQMISYNTIHVHVIKRNIEIIYSYTIYDTLLY